MNLHDVTDGSVDPTSHGEAVFGFAVALVIVLDEHHLSALFEGEAELDRQGSSETLGVARCEPRLKLLGCAAEARQASAIYLVDGGVDRAEANHVVVRSEAVARLVEPVEHFLGARPVANGIQDALELVIVLPEDLVELVALQVGIAPDVCVEEPVALVVLGQPAPLGRVARRNRCELVWVAEHHDLSATERPTVLASGGNQHAVHGVEQIGRHHRDFVDHQHLDRTQNLTRALVEVAGHVFGAEQAGRKAEQRVNGLTGNIERCNAGRCTDRKVLLCVLH